MDIAHAQFRLFLVGIPLQSLVFTIELKVPFVTAMRFDINSKTFNIRQDRT